VFDLVGLGNPVYDVIVTPWARSEGRVLSGCSTNACLAAKRLGIGRVGLIGRVGKDFERRFLFEMKRNGIETFLDSSSGETGGFHLTYDERGNRTLDVLGIAGKISRENFPEKFLNTKFILIGPILGEVDIELIEFIRSSSKAKLFLDPQGLVRVVGRKRRVIHRCYREQFGRIVELTDFVKPNEHESVTITGKKDPVAALHTLQEFGSAVPIITLAERGSILLLEDEILKIPAFNTRAIDPTGAGDVYAGAFITEYLHIRKIGEAALFASAAASLMVEQIGPEFEMSVESVKHREKAISAGLSRQMSG